ncbi:MAG TPA: lytic transglycosylase domain-containing protein [Croceibacterium sp.]|nr:lytic transglycosylase domain-containing protein [Croceibacterium sp.]
MPEISSVQQGTVRAAIARASAVTGVDFNYLLAQAKIESALDPSARADTSSAAGLYQFTSGTWLETLDRHAARHGMRWADDAISRHAGRAEIGDPAMRAHVMSLRFDPDASALMAAELARDNAGELRGVLGREPDATELYMAHFLGIGGARAFLSALQADPGQQAAMILPQAADANRPIFYDSGRPRSVGEVMELMRGKVAAAMDGVTPGWGDPAFLPGLPLAGATPQGAAQPDTPPRRPSMAETLQATFGAAGQLSGAAGERVGRAYAAFKAFDL